ncbi:MAG TPA: type IV pilus biogenesis/stability protein PilW [Dyella sp.]|uniref:type IV pilus biogenesis/stability protein PilW n=1 Tax=Dyella sp. TaxID=1869338 RepID=UPI002D120A6F|nr:type IV pilus biogenesis/stability protein PilW [Dyella sp.]HTV84047.1 type IV pilus biogenesis/stability protein PilW [Dyella sp.]
MRRDWILLGIGMAVLVAGCSKTDMVVPQAPTPKLPEETRAQKAQNAADVHTRLAQHYIDINDLQGALQKVKLAVIDDPNYVPAQTVMAYVYERINDMPNAEIHYRRAVELAPTKGDTNNNLGAFLCRIGKVQESFAYFSKALADPFYATPDAALDNQGVCQLKLNDRVAAEASFRSAIERNPTNAGALLELANVLYMKHDYFNASAYLQRFDALGKPSPDSLKLGYDIETHLGDKDAAQTYSKRLMDQFPDSEQAQALNQIARP